VVIHRWARLGPVLIGLSLLCRGALAESASPVRVQVFPLGAVKLPKPQSYMPSMLTEVVLKQVRDAGHQPELAGATLGETASMVGCNPAEIECLEMLAETIGAAELLYGNVARGQKGAVARVNLTWFVPGNAPVSQTVALRQRNVLEQANEFGKIIAPLLQASLAVAARATPVAPVAVAAAEPTPVAEPAPPQPESPPLAAPMAGPVLAAIPTSPAPAPEQPLPMVMRDATPAAGFSFSRVGALAWIAAGVGVAAAGAGAGLLGMAAGLRDDVADAPTETVKQLEDLEGMEKRGRLYSNAGTGCLVGGGAVVASAIILVVVQGSAPAEPEPVRLGLEVTRTGGVFARAEVSW
jgi:hypothetical protein